jgi:photosystem II stability/assembly factor-like uncharacterized protein
VWERLATRHGGTVAGLAVAGDRLHAATPVGVFSCAMGGGSWAGAEASAQVPFATSIAAAPGGNPLFAGGRDGVYRSDDGGRRWRHLLAADPVQAVAAGPDGLVLAASAVDGVLRSENGGRDWASAQAGLLDLAALCLAMSPDVAGDRTVFLGTASGPYLSQNAGRSWRAVELGPEEAAVQAVALSPRFTEDRLALAGTEVDGLFRSDDGGRRWQEVPLPARSVSAIAIAPPGGPWAVAVATETGVLLAGPDGAWRASGDPPAPVLALAALKGGGLAAGLVGFGVARLADDLHGWRLAHDGLEALATTALQPSPAFARDHTLFAPGADGVLGISRDGGRRFEELLVDPGEPVLSLALSPGFGQDGTLWLATGGGLWRSRDRGRGFELLPPLAEGAAQALLALAGGAGGGPTLLAGTALGQILLSGDGGGGFETIGRLPQGHAVHRLIAPDPLGTILLAQGLAPDEPGLTGGATLWLSQDGGRSWQALLEAPGLAALPALLLHRPDGGQAVCVGIGARLVVLDPAHPELRQESRLDAGIGAITALASPDGPDAGRLIVVGTDRGAWISPDGGQGFAKPWDGPEPGAIAALAIPPGFERHRTVLAAGVGGTIWRLRLPAA